MLKITKGLKKKKKGKKSKKNKDEELFKPEELEAYRQQHQQQAAAGESEGASGENEEWKKFQALTSGIDDVLRKTQGDLDRIKSTSFFQRVPPPSEKAAAAAAAEEAEQLEEKLAEQQTARPTPQEFGVVPVSETESEDEGEEEDDIFDTSFVDAVASGEVKLAYIPESPTTEDVGGDDPFDTSIAERAILGPAYNQKGKKLVPLGAAVEVLTGRVEQPTCATKRPTSTRRKLRQNDLLLGSFDLDDNGNATEGTGAAVPAVKSLLDDDSIPVDAPIDLSGATLYTSPVPIPLSSEPTPQDPSRDIVAEFDVIKPNEDDDDEFAQLAAESLSKKPTVTQAILPHIEPQKPAEINVTFEAEFDQAQFGVEVVEEDEVDPFDTTFADNILPGKAELKLIENEILNAALDEVPVYVEEKFAAIIKSKVSIQLTNPTGERESISSLDRVDESCLNSLQPIHRDLLGGSNTDLSKIGDDPIAPHQPAIDDSFSDYSDPFDTSLVDQASAPGQAELKFIEKEILGEVTITRTLSDPDFNPRDEELEDQKHISRPDILEVNSVKSVAFAIPTPSSQPDLLATGEQDSSKHTKPLTPYYVRENSLPEQPFPDETPVEDPFDTSFVAELAPGKAELKLIENEFITPEPELKRSLSDEDFDPRATEKVVQQPKVPVNLSLPLKETPKPDLLAADDDVSAKVLTPAVEHTSNIELSYSDPFDTSIACNILPGKTELKLLENELINSQPSQIKRNLTDPEFDPRNAVEQLPQPVAAIQDLLGKTEEQVAVKPLTPVDYQVSFEIGGEDEIDPFDTSVAENLVPGRTELKLLESELI